MIEIIRSEILQGVYIVFSGCFPREVAAHKCVIGNADLFSFLTDFIID